MTSPPGSLYLVPNTLDFGAPGEAPDLRDVLPLAVIHHAARLGHWVAENAKTTRAFLKRVDAIVPLAQPLQQLAIIELPRPRKGASNAGPQSSHGTDSLEALRALLAPALAGHDIGLISEAGLPAVADPGAALVQTAHALGLNVVALPGPSSLLLALAASGLNGQSFAFVGYLPIEAQQRGARIRELEALSRQLRANPIDDRNAVPQRRFARRAAGASEPRDAALGEQRADAVGRLHAHRQHQGVARPPA